MSLFTVLVYCKLFMIHSPKCVAFILSQLTLAMHSNIVIYLVCACMYVCVFVCVVVCVVVCVCVCVC